MKIEAEIFRRIILSEINSVEDLGFAADLIVPGPVLNIIIVAECGYGVYITPLIHILPLFENDFLDTVCNCGQFHAEDIDGGQITPPM